MGDRLAILLSEENIETIGNILAKLEKVTIKAEELEDKAIVSLNEADSAFKNFNTNFAKAGSDFSQIQKDFSDIKRASVVTINNLEQTTAEFQSNYSKSRKKHRQGRL